jgi:phosphopantothenoylcysteine decarboxylase/phosphopantothenate--cysteine ligase
MVAGPTSLPTPSGVTRIDVTSTAEMAEAVFARVNACDIFIAVAAAADYTPVQRRREKIKKSKESLAIELQPTTDILANVAARPNPPFCVGFAAESQELLRLADEKRRRKRVPLMVANRAQDAIGSEGNEVSMLEDTGTHPLPRMHKLTLARRLIAEIATRRKS